MIYIFSSTIFSSLHLKEEKNNLKIQYRFILTYIFCLLLKFYDHFSSQKFNKIKIKFLYTFYIKCVFMQGL